MFNHEDFRKPLAHLKMAVVLNNILNSYSTRKADIDLVVFAVDIFKSHHCFFLIGSGFFENDGFGFQSINCLKSLLASNKKSSIRELGDPKPQENEDFGNFRIFIGEQRKVTYNSNRGVNFP